MILEDIKERIGTLDASVERAVGAGILGINTAIPAIVESFNAAEMTVSAQPTIKRLIDGEPVDMPLLVDVPVQFMSGGDFIVTVPIAAGDEVLIVFAQRCIDNWWALGGAQEPAERREHDLSDAFAIPCVFSQPRVVPNIQTDGIELRDKARTTYIKLSASGIEIKGDITHEGNVIQTGDITSSGTITGDTDVVVDGKSLKTHKHTGVTTGGGVSGEMQ